MYIDNIIIIENIWFSIIKKNKKIVRWWKIIRLINKKILFIEEPFLEYL